MLNLYQKISAACIGINLLAIIFIIAIQKNLPPVVPLFYGLPVSQDELVKSIFLVVPPLVSIILIIINVGLVKLTKDRFLEKIFIGLNLSTVVLATITVVKIVLLVI